MLMPTYHKAGLKTLTERKLAWSIAVLLGVVQTAACSFTMNPDGISYLHLADLYGRGEWGSAVNGYWSPLYPLLIAGAAALVQPSPYWEAPLLHVLNFGLYLGTFVAFRYFLSSVRVVQERRKTAADHVIDLSDRAQLAGVYALFFSTTLVWIGLAKVTPDLLVAAIVYGASGLALRLRHQSHVVGFAGLGAVLALGYLAKAVMFPLAIIFIVAAAWTPRSPRLSLRRIVMATLGFSIVASPQVIGLSRQVGHFTYAETGKAAYAREVNHYPSLWLGKPVGSGIPEHPVRMIHENPDVYEFADADITSSYPAWDKPAYWVAGITTRFDVAQQWAVSSPILGRYLELLGNIILVIVALLYCRKKGLAWSYLVLILPALAAFGAYALVYAEPRYLGAWTVVLFVGVVAAMRFPVELAPAVRGVLIALALVEGAGVLKTSWTVYTESNEQIIGDPSANTQLQIASRLHSLGVAEGSRVAVIGYGFDGYWARLSKVQIAMEIRSYDDYWLASDSVKLAVNERLKGAGASAIVSNRVPTKGPGEGWQTVGLGRLYIYPLSPLR